jgi:hypothetical protein
VYVAAGVEEFVGLRLQLVYVAPEDNDFFFPHALLCPFYLAG